MATADKLNKLLNTKAAIKQAIIGKGVDVSDDTIFADYPAKISAIESGSGGGSGDSATYLHPDFYEIRTSGGTNYQGLFYYYKDTTLDLSNFDTSNVTTMYEMFTSCSKLTSLDVSNFDTSNVATMSHMFESCSSLSSLDLSSFNTSNVTTMQHVFASCSKLTSLDLSSFDTSNVTDMRFMFYYCNKLTSLDLSNFDVSKVTSYSSTFTGCPALTDFKAPKNISAAMTFSQCPLTHDSLMSIINNLATVTSTKKLTLGADNLAKLSETEILIGVQKGWTIA